MYRHPKTRSRANKNAIAMLLAAGFVQGAHATPGGLIGSPIAIGTSSSSIPINSGPRVGSDADGNMVATWIDHASGAILAKRFDSSGTASGGTIQVAAPNPALLDDTLTNPTVAVNASGQFVVVWTDFTPAQPASAGTASKTKPAATSHSATTLHARSFQADGTPASSDVQFADMPYNPELYATAAVAMDDAGDFVAGWTKDSESPVIYGPGGPQIFAQSKHVYVRVYGLAGKPKTLPIEVDGGLAIKPWFNRPLTGYWASAIAVGMDGPGNFTVAWFGQELSSSLYVPNTLRVQSFSAKGHAETFPVQVYQYQIEGAETQYLAMAMNRSGQYALAWGCQDAGAQPVCTESFQPGNVAASGEINVYPDVTDPWLYSAPTIAIDANGNFVVGTNVDTGPWVPTIRLFAFNGTPQSAGVAMPRANTDIYGPDVGFGVGMDANGDAEALYLGRSASGSAYPVLLQRISGH